MFPSHHRSSEQSPELLFQHLSIEVVVVVAVVDTIVLSQHASDLQGGWYRSADTCTETVFRIIEAPDAPLIFWSVWLEKNDPCPSPAPVQPPQRVLLFTWNNFVGRRGREEVGGEARFRGN